MFSPELVHEPGARDDLVRMQEQHREQRPLLRRDHDDRLTVPQDLEWPKHPEIHELVLPPYRRGAKERRGRPSSAPVTVPSQGDAAVTHRAPSPTAIGPG
jgi:hypothetical protein